jgi:hypothetical protein
MEFKEKFFKMFFYLKNIKLIFFNDFNVKKLF